MAFDNPGTGECPVTLDENADEVIRGIASYARSIGDRRVAHFGMSFGGNFSAMPGLAGIADCAVDLRGPVMDSFAPEHAADLLSGEHDILGNAMHHDKSLPSRSSAGACRNCRATICLRRGGVHRCW